MLVFLCFFVFLFFFVGLVRSSLLSILVLVFGFIAAAVLIFFMNAEFLSLTYIVVYVGSISMLFLFLIIMIDPRTISELSSELTTFSSSLVSFLLMFFLNFIFFSFESFFVYPTNYSNFSFFDWSRIVYSESNIVSFSEVLFNYCSFEIVLTSICLFVGIVGPLMIFIRDND